VAAATKICNFFIEYGQLCQIDDVMDL